MAFDVTVVSSDLPLSGAKVWGACSLLRTSHEPPSPLQKPEANPLVVGFMERSPMAYAKMEGQKAPKRHSLNHPDASTMKAAIPGPRTAEVAETGIARITLYIPPHKRVNDF